MSQGREYKLWLIVFVLAIPLSVAIVLPAYGQEKSPKSDSYPKRAEGVKGQATPAPPAASSTETNIVKPGVSDGQDDGTKNHPESYLRRLFSPENLPNVGLFIAGIIGILVAVRTLRLMARQTKSTEDSVQSLREIERPWIEVTIEAPPLGPMQVEWVAIVFKNHGRTVADVKEVIISKEHDITIQDMLGERGFRPVHSKDAEELAGEVLLPPGGDFKRLLNLMPWKTHPGSYNAAPVLVWVWGTVLYTEGVTPYTTIEGREHVTNFCYACRFPVVHSHEEASRIQGDDDMRSRILRGFRKTGPWPLNKYT